MNRITRIEQRGTKIAGVCYQVIKEMGLTSFIGDMYTKFFTLCIVDKEPSLS